jgi:formylglycine-generating enzyme required for sulfatase activity
MTETGAYTLSSDGILAYDPTLYIITITRNPGTTWAVTSENEWYKAAYYNPAAGNYYLYPTSSDSAPGNDMADVSHNNANIRTGSGTYPIDSGKYTTLVGEFENSASPYGTFDQGGNVFEWNEVNQEASSYLALRGGSLFFDASFMPSTKRLFIKPKEESLDIGFRVSEVPEPATLSLLALGGLAALRRRRRMA